MSGVLATVAAGHFPNFVCRKTPDRADPTSIMWN